MEYEIYMLINSVGILLIFAIMFYHSIGKRIPRRIIVRVSEHESSSVERLTLSCGFCEPDP